MISTNTIKRAKLVQELVQLHYEPGRHDRCFLWVYRNYVVHKYPMSERTFWRYMGIDTTNIEVKQEDKRQLNLFE